MRPDRVRERRQIGHRPILADRAAGTSVQCDDPRGARSPGSTTSWSWSASWRTWSGSTGCALLDRSRSHGHTFGYLWPRDPTVGLKQLVAEQLALVAERPEVFEVQFTAGRFGWVVVYLDGVDRGELAELTYEAWRLTAPVAGGSPPGPAAC